MSALNEKKTDSVDHMEHANLKEELAAYRHNAGEDFLKAKITPKLWFLLGFCMLNAGAYGFAASIIASSLEQPNLAISFNFAGHPNITNLTGAMVGSFNVGGMFGPVLICLVQDRYGRRIGFVASAFFTLLGAALQAGAQNFAMFSFGRLFAGGGGFSFLLCSIVYIGEVSPASRRGLLGGLVGPGVIFGYITAAFVGLGTFYWSAPINWRVPLILMAVLPAISMALLPFIPESPRWLSMQGRREESLKVLKSLHGHAGDPSFIVAREESFQINAQVDFDKTQPSGWGSMIWGKYKKRSAVAALIFIGNQGTGVQIPVNYGPTIYSSLGFSTPIALTIGVTQLIWASLVASVVSEFSDRMGRRIWLMMSTGGCAVAMSLIAGLAAHFVPGAPDSRAIGGALIFAFFFHSFVYDFGEPVVFTYIGEIFPSNVRVKGIAVGFFFLNSMAMWTLFVQPVADANIGYKYYLVFVCISLTTTILQYFFVPEVRRVPLEEINRCFGDDADVAVFASEIVLEGDEITRVVHQ